MTLIDRLCDAETETSIASYEVQRILFYTHGFESTPEEACFGFTWSHGDPKENSIHQCHIFRCNIPEAVKQVSCKYNHCLCGNIQ